MSTPLSTSVSTPLFSTEYAPVGAWASLSLGVAGRGARIRQRGETMASADFVVAVQREGVATALPFVEGTGASLGSGWKVLGVEAITRTLTACIDEFVAAEAGLSLKIFTPHAALPNPKRSGNLQYATVPGVLLEVTIDNTHSDVAAVGFVGLSGERDIALRPLDWSSKTLCGVGHAGDWILAASLVKEEVFTVQAETLDAALAGGTAVMEPSSSRGGVAIKVAARSKRTVTLAFAFYDAGAATQGGPGAGGNNGRLLYTAYFPRVEAVANFLLQNHQKIRESCVSLDGRVAAACGDPQKQAVFAQAVRSYESRTQLIDAEGAPYFTIISQENEEGRGYRNAMDRVIDQLPWELFRNPWVIRNVFDLATTSYSYHDKVQFASESGAAETGAELRDGGMTFVHDYGMGTCYTPAGTSAYEGTNRRGAGSFMATETLLNGAYLLTSYALMADDTPWAKTRLPFARELLTSMENRDHWDPEQRNGILKAETEKVGIGGAEVTRYVGCGAALERVPGNLVLAVKTFCANLMLTTYFQNNNDLHSADYSYAFVQKTAGALVAAFNAEAGVLPANLLDASTVGEKVIAALEPLAVPTYLGLTSTLAEYFPELFNVLKQHAISCLKGGCVDAATGGLRLTSGGGKTLPAKVVSVLFVLERLFGIDVQAEYPGAWHVVTMGGADAITAALFVKQAPAKESAEPQV